MVELTRRRGLAMGALTGLAAIVGTVVTGMVGVTAYRVRRSELRHGQPSLRVPGAADAIVVFGARVHPDRPSPELARRLDHAIELWRAGVAPVIAVSGGIDGHLDEVVVMSEYLVQQGVPVEAVVPARPGGNTRETLRAVAQLDGRRFVAVSSPYHSYRIEAEARRAHVAVVTDCPATTPEYRSQRLARVRRRSEVVGVLFYALPDPVAVVVRRRVGRLRHTVPDRLAGIHRTHSQPTAGGTSRPSVASGAGP